MTASRIAIFASGSGTNAEKIIQHFQQHPDIEVAMVLSNNSEAPVLQRSANLKVPTRVFNKQQLRETGQVLQWLQQERITHLVLAGFLWHVPDSLLQEYPDRIINIHPALLPKFGGK